MWNKMNKKKLYTWHYLQVVANIEFVIPGKLIKHIYTDMIFKNFNVMLCTLIDIS